MAEDVEHPDTEWNSALELVIKKEGEQSETLYWLHHKASIWARKRNDYLQIPSILLATITGFFSATSDLVPPIAIGAMSLTVGALGTINNYYKFSQRAENHRMISQMYYKIYKQIEVELSLPISQRIDPDKLLVDLREKMTRIGELAVEIPEGIIALFKKQFPEKTISVPIIANGLDPIKIFQQVAVPATPQKPDIRITITDTPKSKGLSV